MDVGASNIFRKGMRDCNCGLSPIIPLKKQIKGSTKKEKTLKKIEDILSKYVSN